MCDYFRIIYYHFYIGIRDAVLSGVSWHKKYN